MTDREALLAAVIANPLDDTPRLVFADWLDEHGEPELAEFIRVQIELAKGHPQGLKPSKPNLFNTPTREFHKWGKHSAWGKQHKNLRERERELFLDNAIGRFFPHEMGCRLTRTTDIPASDQEPTAMLRRGFPSKVTLPDLAAWERWGAEIVRAAPVTEIVISDRHVDPDGDVFGPQSGLLNWWWKAELPQDPDDIPIPVFDRMLQMVGHGTSNRSRALSLAARAFADESRSRAGLPPVWSKEQATV